MVDGLFKRQPLNFVDQGSNPGCHGCPSVITMLKDAIIGAISSHKNIVASALFSLESKRAYETTPDRCHESMKMEL